MIGSRAFYISAFEVIKLGVTWTLPLLFLFIIMLFKTQMYYYAYLRAEDSHSCTGVEDNSCNASLTLISLARHLGGLHIKY